MKGNSIIFNKAIFKFSKTKTIKKDGDSNKV